ncbi:hypothetical protein NGK36_17235 [Hafnia alvei]|uniref:hypothetical protein n=1 Tax=Hafnia alvei TaxID=569 RepID=UPI002DB64118|nr:hypothetical protein [Hafnia alvei]MEB7891016.1 hypothetical protein [Hafnia alvei]
MNKTSFIAQISSYPRGTFAEVGAQKGGSYGCPKMFIRVCSQEGQMNRQQGGIVALYAKKAVCVHIMKTWDIDKVAARIKQLQKWLNEYNGGPNNDA